MATGGGAAYRQLEREKNYLGDYLDKERGYLNAEQAAKKLADEREGVREDAANKVALDLIDADYESFNVATTNFDSVDSIMADYVNSTGDQYASLGREARLSYERGDKEGYHKNLAAQKKLYRNFNTVKNGTAAIAQNFADLQEWSKTHKVSPVDAEYIETMQSYLNNDFRVVNDGSQIPQIQVKTKDGYVTKRVSELIDYKMPYEELKLSGDAGWVNQVAKNLGMATTKDTKGGYYIDKKNLTPEGAAGIDQAIFEVLNSDEKMSSALFQANGTKKKKDFTPDEQKVVQKYLKDRVMGNVSTEKKKTFNSAADASARGWKALKKDEKAYLEEVYDAERVTDTEGEGKGLPTPSTGKELGDVGAKYVFKNKKGSNAITGIISDDQSAEVVSATVLDGKIVAEVRKTSKASGAETDMMGNSGAKKTTTETDTYTKELTETEMGRMALSLNLKNAKEVVDYLSGRDNTNTGGASAWNKK